MSIKVSAQVWEHGPRERNMRFVLLAIADNANDEGYAFPLVKTIADKCVMTTRNVLRVLEKLTSNGWVEVQVSPKDYKANAYQINLSKLSHEKLSRDKTDSSQVTKSTFSGDISGEHILINVINSKKNRQPRTPQQKSKLPPWLDAGAWAAFVEMRVKIRRPLTETGIQLIWRKLEGFRVRGIDTKAVLEQSILNSYQGVFEPKEEYGSARKDKFSQNAENLRAALRGQEDDHGGAGGDGVLPGNGGPRVLPQRILEAPRIRTPSRSPRVARKAG
jgi:DNA-binding MarR family transcriptional regulator